MRYILTVHTNGTLLRRLCLRAWPCLREGVEGRARERRAPRGVMVLALPQQSCLQHCRRGLALPRACKASKSSSGMLCHSTGMQCTGIRAHPL